MVVHRHLSPAQQERRRQVLDAATALADAGGYDAVIMKDVAEQSGVAVGYDAEVFQRISDSTGGKAYFAKDWKAQQDAFSSIRDDLSHLYSISYYPAANSNRGWRDITVKLSGDHLKKYKVRARTGYRPRPARMGG